MGNSQSNPAATVEPAAKQAEPQVPKGGAAEPGCPVKSGTAKKALHGCPVDHSKKEKKAVYNVYAQEIDPTNNMPYNPNQEPREDQKYPLEVQRVHSTIPKGGTDSTWTYPSEQMFFNALRRKGKGEDAHEGDMGAIVAIHNNMNERTWKQVAEWENKLHPGSNPRLLKFMGKPDDLSPLARIKSWMSGELPFDRHDWIVEREDGTQQRYVIDYYYDDEKSTEDEVPELHSADKVRSISMYARPAVDSVGSLVDRIRFPILSSMKNDAGSESHPTATAPAVSNTAAPSNRLTVDEVANMFERIKASCKDCFAQVKTCETEESCATAASSLQLCMARIACKDEADAFSKALKTKNEEEALKAYDSMVFSLEKFEEMATDVMRQQAIEAAKATSSDSASQ